MPPLLLAFDKTYIRNLNQRIPFMNRLTRFVASVGLNSPELHRFFTSITTKTRIPLPLLRNNSLTLSLHSQSFPSRFIKTSSFASINYRSSDPIPPAMELNPPESGEDFVHIENPNPDNVEPLSESVVSVGDEAREENETVSEETRKVLPEELSRSVLVLTCESSAEGGACDVYLVGTAHVSRESCEEVQAVIEFLKPEVVFLELCSSRVAVLSPQNLKVPTVAEMIDMWKKKQNMFGILYSWFLAKVASKLEVFPGSEFRVAYEEATKYGGKVILGDRPIQITLRRTWGVMPLWHKTKLLYSLLFQAFFLPSPADLNRMLKEMDDVDMLTLVIQETSKQFPTLMETLVHERDQYMSSTLLRVASEHHSVVAVVGKGHLQGIKKYWKQPISTKDLLTIPSKKPAVSATRILTTLGAGVAGVAIISGIYLKCKK